MRELIEVSHYGIVARGAAGKTKLYTIVRPEVLQSCKTLPKGFSANSENL